MNARRLVFALGVAVLLSGCVAGPGKRAIVIETGAPSFADADNARALAMRLTPERVGGAGTRAAGLGAKNPSGRAGDLGPGQGD